MDEHDDLCPLNSECHVTMASHRVESVGGDCPHDRCAICVWWCICERLRQAREEGRSEGVDIQLKIDLDVAREDVWDEAQRDALADAVAVIAELEKPMPNVPMTSTYLAGLQAARRRITAIKEAGDE